ncbi:hypothetical protein L484_020661 [Morus notabilis]|uniref:FAF domain-containing protein n=2 Tax=Morus notabilis TaxID=981085 RepID=W9SXK1_9ROSA|nr:hypothetical protein L484_020661 [Morus notabilis]
MMSFCRKSVHSLLGLTAASVDAADHRPHNVLNPPWKCQALGLVTATSEIIRRPSPNVLESSSMISQNSPPPSPPTRKKDPRGIGFIDDIGGGVDGLMSCTESLGFESSDERRVDDDEEEFSLVSNDERPWTSKKVKWRKRMSGSSKEVKRFPPLLSSLNRNGQPSFFLRPVRKDGRLELTEVRINRPEILRAYRGDGRLRLHLIRDDEDEDEDYIDEEEKQQEQGEDDDIREEKVEESVIREEDEEEEERNVNGEEWKIPVSSTGDGFRRCHDVANHHHHLHVWRPHCVTTR